MFGKNNKKYEYIRHNLQGGADLKGKLTTYIKWTFALAVLLISLSVPTKLLKNEIHGKLVKLRALGVTMIFGIILAIDYN